MKTGIFLGATAPLERPRLAAASLRPASPPPFRVHILSLSRSVLFSWLTARTPDIQAGRKPHCCSDVGITRHEPSHSQSDRELCCRLGHQQATTPTPEVYKDMSTDRRSFVVAAAAAGNSSKAGFRSALFAGIGASAIRLSTYGYLPQRGVQGRCHGLDRITAEVPGVGAGRAPYMKDPCGAASEFSPCLWSIFMRSII